MRMTSQPDSLAAREGDVSTSAPSTAVPHACYTPLKSWQTRLIRLAPARFHEPISCDLFRADVIAQPGPAVSDLGIAIEYEAVSYSWGWPDPTEDVLCNGQVSLVSPNLEEALRYLRQEEDVRWLWCDALCINQNDLVEKAQQVQMMLLIFSKARQVIAWLGKHTDDEERHAFEGIGETRTDGLTQNQNLAITLLTEKPWFFRTWVRQETFAATLLCLQLGQITRSWVDLVNVFSGHHSRGLPQQVDSLDKLRRMSKPILTQPHHMAPHPEDRYNLKLGLSLFRTLRGGAGFGATDARDRVYAVHGILQNQVQGLTEMPPIDYSKSIEEVYQDATRLLVNVTRCFDIVLDLRAKSTQRARTSWAIDWRQSEDMLETFCFSIGVSTPKCMSRWTPFQENALTQEYGPHRGIQVEGLEVGSISMTQRGYNFPTDMSFRRNECIEIANQLLRINLYKSVSIDFAGYLPRRRRLDDISTLAPIQSRLGDILMRVWGSNFLWVVRPTDTARFVSLIGPVFMHEERSGFCMPSRDFGRVHLLQLHTMTDMNPEHRSYDLWIRENYDKHGENSKLYLGPARVTGNAFSKYNIYHII